MMTIFKFEPVCQEFLKHPETPTLLPSRGTVYSAGNDFYLKEDITIYPFQQVLSWTDVKVYLPRGYYLSLSLRSSIAKKSVIIPNAPCVIDRDYVDNKSTGGNIAIILLNVSSSKVILKAGERIMQGIAQAYITQVSAHRPLLERKGGFGSTGD